MILNISKKKKSDQNYLNHSWILNYKLLVQINYFRCQELSMKRDTKDVFILNIFRFEFDGKYSLRNQSA